MLAKRLFYVCAGLLCLALAYHLGARNATGQGQVIGAVGFDTYDRPIIAIGHTLYEMGDQNDVYTPTQPVPGTSPIVGIAEHNVVLENGDVYGLSSGEWHLRGNFFGPTSTTQETWGGVKARYR